MSDQPRATNVLYRVPVCMLCGKRRWRTWWGVAFHQFYGHGTDWWFAFSGVRGAERRRKASG